MRDSASVSACGIGRWPLVAASGEVAWDWMRDSAISGARGMADAAFGDVDWVCLRDSTIVSARGIGRWPLVAASGEVAWDWMRDSAISGARGMADAAFGDVDWVCLRDSTIVSARGVGLWPMAGHGASARGGTCRCVCDSAGGRSV
jgi:hypothetical protein